MGYHTRQTLTLFYGGVFMYTICIPIKNNAGFWDCLVDSHYFTINANTLSIAVQFIIDDLLDDKLIFL